MARQKRKFNTSSETNVAAQQIGVRKRFHVNDLVSFSAKNPRQEKFFEEWAKGTEIISLLGFPGTGKSLCAIYAALHSVLRDDTPQEKVVIVRSNVVCGSDIGFLPGTAAEKLEPFEAPYRSLVKEIMRYNDPYEHLKSLGYLEFIPPTHLRGMTFNNAVIIIEECQNFEYDTLYTAISRCGYNSRIILTGDVNQDDLKNKRKTSGLAKLMRVFNQMPLHSNATVNFQLDDVVRSGITRDFIIAAFQLDEN